MDFREPTDNEIKNFRKWNFQLSREQARLHLVKQQLSYYMQNPFRYNHIEESDYNIFFIKGDPDSKSTLLRKEGKYYLLNDNCEIIEIKPLNDINSECAELFSYHIQSNNIGNGIYINYHPEGSRFHVIIYFNETCQKYSANESYLLGDRIIRPFYDYNGNIIVVNDLGEKVPHYTIECPGKDYEFEIDNDQMRLVVTLAENNEKEESFIVEYKSKGRRTKAAPRLPEQAAE